MPASTDRDPSVAPTLAWFAVLAPVALVLAAGGLRGLDGVRGLVDRSGGGEPAAPAAAGPAFVAREAARAAELTEAEVDDVADAPAAPALPAPAAGAPAPAAASAHGLVDACVEPRGATTGCIRWALDGARAGFHRARAGGAPLRLSLWGDSLTAEGYIADGMRRRLARELGDGGAGFVFLARPSRWYRNPAVRLTHGDGWKVHSVVANSIEDRRYGYGGASFTGAVGQRARFRTAEAGAGSAVSRFELYYLQHPGGGTAEVRVDGVRAATVDTRGPLPRSAFAAIDLPDGPHTIDVVVTAGTVRAFGATLERATGAVVDSLGIVSNSIANLSELERAHWGEQLAHRDADVLMVLLGANESAWVASRTALAEFRKSWGRVLSKLRAGNPDATCLVIGTLDAGTLEGGTRFVPRPGITGMIAAERDAAAAHGCAFWDARAFMGGEGAARRWYRKGLMSGDFEHLTDKGGRVLGGAVIDALQAAAAPRGAP